MSKGTYEEEALKDLRVDLQDLFLGNDRGKRVLKFLMVELGVFDEIVTDDDRVLHNYGVRLLNFMGIYEPWQVKAIIHKYSELPRSAPGKKQKKGSDMLKEEK